MLFISQQSAESLPALLQHSHSVHALTVSDIDTFAAKGGIIGMVKENDRFAFEVNIDAAKNTGIRLSSHLLKLARKIHKGTKD